jgi:hypothetical protein
MKSARERHGRGHDQSGIERGPERLSSIYVSLSWALVVADPGLRRALFVARPSSRPGAHFNGVFANLLQTPEHSSPIVVDNDSYLQ